MYDETELAEKYPFLREINVFELRMLQLEAEKYNDKEFWYAISFEFKRRDREYLRGNYENETR